MSKPGSTKKPSAIQSAPAQTQPSGSKPTQTYCLLKSGTAKKIAKQSDGGVGYLLERQYLPAGTVSRQAPVRSSCLVGDVSALRTAAPLIHMHQVAVNLVAEPLAVGVAGLCHGIQCLAQRLGKLPHLACLATTEFVQCLDLDRVPALQCRSRVRNQSNFAHIAISHPRMIVSARD